MQGARVRSLVGELRSHMLYQFSSVAQSCPTHCNPMDCSTPGFPVHHQLQDLAQTHVHWVLFQWVSSLHQVAKVFEFQLQHQSFQWIFRADFLYDGPDWSPAAQGNLKRLLQNHNSKASILWRSTFFMVQLSHPYMTIGQTIALTRQTFVGIVMSLLFKSRLVIAFLPRSKCLLISWLQSPSAVIFEPPKIVCYCCPIYLPRGDGTWCHDLSFLNVEF